MNVRSTGHPDLKMLALHAGKDLPLHRSMRVRLHLVRCGECEQQLSRFRATMLSVREEAERAPFENSADWRCLEREMMGNIGVGVAAARCIERVGHRRQIFSTGSLLIIGLAVLFVIGWFTHIPSQENERLITSLRRIIGTGNEAPQSVLLRTTAKGIAVHTQGATLTMMHPASALVTVSGASGVEARYVDEDTGQVTITNVYGQ